MQTEATIQQKAMQDIFALEEAVGQFESFGSQLDLGLPTEEDNSPKSFDDMLEVNPSNEPMEYGENFMSEGDDLQDTQTQKFVVDEFAKQLAELPDGSGVTAADITGISAIIQMNNHITGDVRSFIDQTINHAVQAQQQQNVSEAQPNGTVAQDLAKTGDNVAADNGLGAGPDVLSGEPNIDGGIPTMEPIDPTAEPSLDANPSDGLGLDGGLGTDVGDSLAGMGDGLGGADDGLGGESDLGGADAGAEEDPLAGMDNDLAGLDDNGPEPSEPETTESSADNDSELDNLLDSGDDNSTEEDDKKSSEEDNDDDFNFEAIATKARGLLENNETDGASVDGNAADSSVADQAQTEGADAAVSDVGGDVGGDAGVDTDSEFECSFAKKAAKVEAIVNQTKMKMAADEANAILESYHKDRERNTTLAKLDGVVNALKQKVVTESIVADFAKKSKQRALNESIVDQVYGESEPVPSVFEATMNRINKALKTTSLSNEADKIIAEFESTQTANKKPMTESATKAKPVKNLAQVRIDSLLESAAKKTSIENQFTAKLNSLLEGVKNSNAAKNASDNLDKQLNDIVAQVKNS